MTVAAAMAAKPDASLPRQAGAWPELVGAYRLLNNPAVTPEAIAAPHWGLTRARCGRGRVVLCVQDTSDIDHTGYGAKAGLGPIGRQKGRGFLQHTCLAVLPNGSLLGVLDQRWHVRTPAPAGETRAARLARWNEGLFWADMADAVGPPPAGVRFVTVADRGGDNVETFAACGRAGHDFVVRAQHDRLVDGGAGLLWGHAAALPAALPAARAIKVKVPARRGSKGSAKSFLAKNCRAARTATVEVRFGRVLLDPPKKNPAHKDPRWVNVVYAREVGAPADVKEPIGPERSRGGCRSPAWRSGRRGRRRP